MLRRQIALTTMRRIGSKAHPLIVVNYFAWVIVLVAGVVVMIEQPPWAYSVKAWGFMVVVGVFGGLMVCLSALPPSVRSSHCITDTWTVYRSSSSQLASLVTELLHPQS